MNIPTISDEAREAASRLRGTNATRYDPVLTTGATLLETEIQLAINKATEKLTQENESLQKQVMGLREALQRLPQTFGFAEIMTLHVRATSDGELACAASETLRHIKKARDTITDALSSTPDFSKQFVRREVLEKLVEAYEFVSSQGFRTTTTDKALALAKAELEGGK